MAEGLQRRIEYSDLKFISSFAMEKILDFQTWEEPGEHARGNFRLLLSENETGINSMDAPIQLLGQGNTAGALFSGYPEKVEIKEERGYSAGVNEDDKPMVAVATNEAARKAGIKAGDLVRGAAKVLGGGGGGKPDFAQGGGVDASKIDEALEALKHEAQKA